MSQTRIEENLKWCITKLVDAELHVFTNEYGSEFDNRCLVHMNVINRTLDCLSEMRAEIERKDLALRELENKTRGICFLETFNNIARLALEDKP